jgi:hypothetical protein
VPFVIVFVRARARSGRFDQEDEFEQEIVGRSNCSMLQSGSVL